MVHVAVAENESTTPSEKTAAEYFRWRWMRGKPEIMGFPRRKDI